MRREELTDHLRRNTRVLKSERTADAFDAIDRADFVEEDYLSEAYEDYALPLGYEQTISEPTTVAFMLELLDPQAGDMVLDVGSGSGYTTALMAEIVGTEGKVIGSEIIPELVEKSRANLLKYDFPHVIIEEGNRNFDTSNEDYYDRILVNAAAEDIPQTLLDKLNVGGVMVIPVGDTVVRIEKVSKDAADVKSYEGFNFVPLVYNP